jgi:hypothetical protein
MKHKVFIHSTQSGSDAACAIIIVPDEGNILKKILPMKDCAKNKADLFGIKYAIAMVDNKNNEIIINIDNGYILGMVDVTKKGTWAKEPNKYQDLISDMREHINNKIIKIIYGTGPLMGKVKWWSQSVYRLRDGLPPNGKTPLEV